MLGTCEIWNWFFSFMLFYVVSNEGMMYHYPDCPIGSDKPGQAYKPGPGPPKDIIYKRSK